MDKNKKIPQIDMRKLDDFDKMLITFGFIAFLILVTMVGIIVTLKH